MRHFQNSILDKLNPQMTPDGPKQKSNITMTKKTQMSTAHTHTHIHTGLLNVNKTRGRPSRCLGAWRPKTNGHFTGLTSIKKTHVQSVQCTHESARVRDGDGERAITRAVSVASEWRMQQHGAVNHRSNTAAIVSLQWSRALPVLTLSPSYGKCPVLHNVITLSHKTTG